MTRNQIGATGAKGSRVRQQTQAKSTRVRQQAQARSAPIRQRAARSGAARRARRTAAQMTPVAMGLGLTARRGFYNSRVWAAPQLEHAAHAVQERVAPKVAEMLIAAARQVQPAPRSRRVRWPVFAAGVALLAGGGAAAAFLLARRNDHQIAAAERRAPTPTASQASADEASSAESDSHLRSR